MKLEVISLSQSSIRSIALFFSQSWLIDAHTHTPKKEKDRDTHRDTPKMRIVSVLAIVILMVMVFPTSLSIIYELENENLHSYHMFRVGMFSPSEAPSKTPPGNGRSYIEASFSIRPSTTNSDVSSYFDNTVYFAVYHSRHFDAVGSVPKGTHFVHVFCSGESTLNWGLPMNASSTYAVYSYPLWSLLNNQSTIVSVGEMFEIQESGLYYILLTSCGTSTSLVSADGAITAMNPYGHLPGGYFGMLPFYGLMFALLFILFIPWVVLSLRWKKELLRVQHLMTVIYVVTIVEAVSYLARYARLNETGHVDHAGLVWCILTSLIRKTVSRVLVLSVSFGFGVVRPTLGKTMNKIFAAAILYFLCAGALEWAQANYASGRISIEVATIFAVPVSILDALFYMVTFRALADTVSELRARRQAAKIKLYRRFINTLIGYVLFSISWIVFEGFWAASSAYETHWNYEWMFDGIWFLAYVVVFLVMCVLWRPSENNTRYAFSLDMSMIDEVDEEELAQVTVGVRHAGGTVRTRHIGASSRDLTSHQQQQQQQLQGPAGGRVHPLTNFALTEDEDEEEDAVVIGSTRREKKLHASESTHAVHEDLDRAAQPTLLRQPTEEEDDEDAGRPLLG